MLSYIVLYYITAYPTYAIRKSFQELFWKCKSINLKKLKLSQSPSPQWPQAALRLGGDGRQVS